MDLPDVTMSTADVIAARNGQNGSVATPDGPRASRPKRRTFTRQYKMRILDEYENASTPQERNALLRREGIWTAYISEWRRDRDRRESEAAQDKKKPGRPGKSPAEAENADFDPSRMPLPLHPGARRTHRAVATVGPLEDLAAAAGLRIEAAGKLPLLRYVVAVRPA